MDAAILSSVADRGPELLAGLFRLAPPGSKAGDLCQPVGRMLGARNRPEEIETMLLLLAKSIEAPRLSSLVEKALDGFLTGAPKSGAKPELTADLREAFQSLLRRDSPKARNLMLELAGRWLLLDSPLVQSAFEQAALDAMNRGIPEDARIAAICLMSNGPFEGFRANAVRLMSPGESIAVQRGVIQAVAPLDNNGVAEFLLAGWASHTPTLREAAMDALFRQSGRLPVLMNAIDKGVVSRAQVSPLRRLQLLEHGDDRIRALARKVFGGAQGADDGIDLEPYVRRLAKKQDHQAGRTLFQTHCQVCHEFDGAGNAVGPSLDAERNRAAVSFLNDILRPNGQISAGYASYIATTKDGSEYTGVMASESATSISLKQANAVEQILLRRDIASLRAADISIMPANFAELLNPDQAADLIGFLKRGEDKSVGERLLLFEDEAAFLAKLPDGSGKTSLIEDEPFSGRYAIHLTPFQSHAVRIPGWSYPIRERPNPGEFRFLRLAWKAPKAKGALIELADNGRWPPAKKAIRRYYSGENTTDWAALEVSDIAPREWTTATVDLWKDNGDMTLTGIALSALNGDAYFDRIELLRSLKDLTDIEPTK